MTQPVEFEFVTSDGSKLTGKADSYSSGDPSVGIWGPYYEETWAEDENGQQVTLSDADDDRLFQLACEIAGQWDDEP